MEDPVAMSATDNAAGNRMISLGDGLARIPERLLLAHARGEVLFIAGAGVSISAGLPSFRDLVLKVYKQLDPVVHTVMCSIPQQACAQWGVNGSGLTDQQVAEVKRFISGDYDVVLGMLERRMDQPNPNSSVRATVAKELRRSGRRSAKTHRALMRLADRGDAVTIITTNFDLLLEEAARKKASKVQTYVLGGIPRPGRNSDFSGVLHIHGALDRNPEKTSDMILTDHDFRRILLTARCRSLSDLRCGSAIQPRPRRIQRERSADAVSFERRRLRWHAF